MLEVMSRTLRFNKKAYQIMICAPRENEFFNRVTVDGNAFQFRKINGGWTTNGMAEELVQAIRRQIEKFCIHYNSYSLEGLGVLPDEPVSC
jgi:hypothetical protein